MSVLKRGMVIDIDLDPTKGSETGKVRPCVVVTNDVYNERVPVIQVVPVTAWSEKKARIITNVEIDPTPRNGLTKKSVADCLQTRPIDYAERLFRVRGELEEDVMSKIDEALKVVFGLDG
ncbi:type II toxin-antitoxin system PemK/MazF family toxin [Acetomicrobium sp. UBA5826]|uniref:type II toxin-antitoxin system PemK/MazF family toxin n=1 Tax=Acetomicrobium sp. UBA5826 TaxID=1946039 RepID=UPI00257FE52F|nr:type II toxin-antitoxin system PemK/MazF family toxin [Acetomicrobium sp. UBA5826]